MGEVAAQKGQQTRPRDRSVMAWARDCVTGSPRYILEIDRDKTGRKCGCECSACGQPLEAVNAGRPDATLRPHFRHPPGFDHGSCAAVAAASAVVKLIEDAGLIELPKRARRGVTVGLSGAEYEAWAKAPPQAHRVTAVTWSDRAHAELTLDDGRRILVRLSGSAGVTAEGIGAVITIDLGDDVEAVASMSPEEIRARLRLLPEHGLRWEAHWCDAELSEQAQRQADERAFECLDRESDGEAADPALPATQRRETMLHRLVKEIIEMRTRLLVPAVGQPGDEEGDRAQRSLDALWETARPSEWLKLEEVRSEQAFAGLVPDLQCRARAESDDFELENLVIEVVVSNPVSEQKLALLREAGAAVLAIELQRAGGRVTRGQLEQMVIEDLNLKRWLLHPLHSNAAQLHPRRTAALLRLSPECPARRFRWAGGPSPGVAPAGVLASSVRPPGNSRLRLSHQLGCSAGRLPLRACRLPRQPRSLNVPVDRASGSVLGLRNGNG